MYINKLISYKNSWANINEKHQNELKEILSSLDDFFSTYLGVSTGTLRTNLRDTWEKALYDRGWDIVDRTHFSADGTRINIGRIGPIKNGLSAAVPIGPIDNTSRWIFQQSTLAVKLGIVKIPILLLPTRSFSQGSDLYRIIRESFENSLNQLELLAPLSHQHPFLVIGYSNQATITPPEVIELESDSYVEKNTSAIDRCIEFPPEYHQAGLGILNFFGTYLREQYPDINATVKIEQQGLNVRMIVETEDGKSEVIERALHEYELVVSGVEPPEKFAKSDKLILELRGELRIAQLRIQTQQDLIGMQSTKIDQLLTIISDGLSQKHQVTIDFKPEIKLINTNSINHNISAALSTLNELKEEIPRTNDAYSALAELEGSLAAIESDNDSESVRRSPAMSKFKRLIDKITDDGSELNAAIKKVESGWEIFSELATKYNKIAEWCGLPVVPSAIIK